MVTRRLRRWLRSSVADSVIRLVKTPVTIRTIRPADALSIRRHVTRSYSIFNGGVQVSVPNNWRQINDQNSVWFVPEGGYGQYNGQAVLRMARVLVCADEYRNLQRVH